MKKELRKIVLINPKKPLQNINPRIHRMFERNKDVLKPWAAPPLNLLTIAAFTPHEIEVQVIDEHYEQIDFNIDADLIGLTAMTHQAKRAYEIAKIFRERNIPVVMGGIHASVLPEEALLNVNTVFIGEAEDTWENYLKDLQLGQEKRIYKNEKLYDLLEPKIPRYDLVNYEAFKNNNDYFNHIPVQATRGCPHNCNFCTVSKLYGTSIRKKNINQIIREIENLKSNNDKSLVFFVDDNLFVDKVFAKSLLTALNPLKIKYIVQSDISVADDSELLNLAYKSGCEFIFVGLESLCIESLSEINKSKWKMKKAKQYTEGIKKIQKNGIFAFGAFIMGFEHDNLGTFTRVKEFVINNNLPAQFTLLTPIPGSRLFTELKEQDRLLQDTQWDKYGFFNLVFKHKNFSPDEAEEALIDLYDEVFNQENSFKRFKYMKDIYKNLPQRWT